MAGGLAALLDDVAVIAKMASSAGSKAVAVVVDDAAVTPQYVRGFTPARELPIIWKITKGSLLNKAILIVLLLLLDQFLPFVLTPLLMLGGLYLSFEGAEKLWEKISGHKPEEEAGPAVDRGPDFEKKMTSSAIRTDFILSAEIMVITLNAVKETNPTISLFPKAGTLVLVAIGITALVYGVVALLVKMDDIGLHMTEQDREGTQKLGRTLVNAMPHVMNLLSTVGMIAMLWVGGHILLSGADKLGWHEPYGLVHTLSEPAAHVAVVGGFLAWLVDTLCSAIVGLVVGAIIAVIIHFLPFGKKHGDETSHTEGHAVAPGAAGSAGASPADPARRDADDAS